MLTLPLSTHERLERLRGDLGYSRSQIIAYLVNGPGYDELTQMVIQAADDEADILAAWKRGG